jgi:hypothetical protein
LVWSNELFDKSDILKRALEAREVRLKAGLRFPKGKDEETRKYAKQLDKNF